MMTTRKVQTFLFVCKSLFWQGAWYSARPNRGSQEMVDVEAIHAAFFDRVNTNVDLVFENMQQAFIVMQLDMRAKIEHMRQRQAMILTTTRASSDAADALQINIEKIDRTFDATKAYAGNLSHVKLTLARIANLVSPDGPLDQLVTQTNGPSNQVC